MIPIHQVLLDLIGWRRSQHLRSVIQAQLMPVVGDGGMAPLLLLLILLDLHATIKQVVVRLAMISLVTMVVAVAIILPIETVIVRIEI